MRARRLAGPPDQQHLGAGRRGPLAQLGADARRASARPAARPHPTARRARRAGRSAPSTPSRPSTRARASLASAHRKLTRPSQCTSSGDDPEQPLPDQPPGQHQPALLVERQVARAQLGAARGPPRAPAGSAPARRGSGRRAAPRAGRPCRPARRGGPGRRRSRVSSSIASSASPSTSAPSSRGGREVRKRRTSASITSAGSTPRSRSAMSERCRPSWWARACGSSR